VEVVEDAKDYDALDDAFTGFIRRHGRKPENRLLFYFAGHGHTVKNYGEEMGYIIPTSSPNPNHDLDGFLDSAMDMRQIEVYAQRIRSKHALFLFDSCFSGSLFALSRAVPENISYKTTKPVRQFITSGSAEEQVPDTSIFRQQFVAALGGEGDTDGDRYITAIELGEFLQKTVVNYSRNAQHPQYGKIRNPNLDKGDFVFALPKAVTEPQPSSTSEAPASATPQAASVSEIRADEEMWKEVKDSNNPEDFEDFLAAFPESKLAPVVRIKLKRLKRKQAKAEQQQIAEAKRKAEEEQKQQLAEEAKQEEERKRQEAEQRRIAEAKRKAEAERKRQEELAALKQKQESSSSETAIDSSTGLMWQKEPFEFELNWLGAVEYCNNLELGGFDNWKLPTLDDYPSSKSEILSGVNKIHYGRNEQFWTLSEVDSLAWTADFSSFTEDLFELKEQSWEYRVRCIRNEKAEAERKRQEELAALQQKQESAGEWTEPSTGMKFRRIPGGSFRMGSPTTEEGRYSNEQPHTVRVGEFWLGETEVTQAQWQAVMGSNPSYFKSSDRPVEQVSWKDVQEFIRKLNNRTGKRFRLPTEAEWEYAARAGTQTTRYWGDGIGRNNANCNGCGSRWDGDETAPVRSFTPNTFGLHDMLGNVWEWTCSQYKKSYDGSEQKCAVSDSTYSLRGGSWNYIPRWVRAAYRFNYFPDNRFISIGFRLAQD
jgi:formylglycine-generating enzyme required for sulfatase activity